MEEVLRLSSGSHDLGRDGVGQRPDGLPVNVDLREAPTCLFVIQSRQHHVHVGGCPWMYIRAVSGAEGHYTVSGGGRDFLQ